MASTSGTAVSLAAVYDALHTFVTANGWTLYDTLPSGGTRDRLYTSAGTGGNLNMLYRLTSNAEAGNPWKNPGSYQVAVPQIIARGYHAWDVGTDTGTNEYGILDPWFTGPTNTVGQLWYYNRINSASSLTDATTPFISHISNKGANTVSTAIPSMFDGRRRVYQGDVSGSGPNSGWILDLASLQGDGFNFTKQNNNQVPYVNPGVWVWDSATNKEYFYYLSQIATLANQWWRYDVDANVSIRLSAPVWTAANPTGSALVWDGADTIYALRGNNSAEFAKYVISTGVWSNLTAAPANQGSYGNAAGPRDAVLAYVPNSVTAFGEDVVYFRPITGTSIYRYNTVANTWNTPLTVPFSMSDDTFLLFDNQRYLYVWRPSAAVATQLYRTDMTSSPGTFTNMGVVDSTTRGTVGAFITNTPTASLRCSDTLGMKYWFVGDADSITAVVRIGDASLSAKYYWFRFGKYVSNYKTQIMTLTGTASAGVRATVSVDSTAGYSANEKVTIFNAATGIAEQVVIYDILSATQFRVNTLVNTFPSGAKAGSDVVQHILTGDSGFGTTALLATGFKPDYNRPWYYVSPDPDTITRNITYSGRSAYMPLDFQIRNPFMTTAGTYPTTGSLPFANCEFLGRITNVYALPTQTYPGPQPEDIIVINGQNYMFFPQSETAWLAAPNNIGVVVGPF